MRVLTLNVWHDAGDPRRTGLLNGELLRAAPDLVALQEVRAPGQLERLLAGAGLPHVTHQADVLAPLPAELERFGGTAVATRWPHRVVEVVEHRGDEHRGEPHRWTLAVAVEAPFGGELLFVVPTTPWQPGAEAVREQQLTEVADLDARHGTALPTIVAGDLNALPDAPSIRRLAGRYRDAWAVAGDGPGHTWSEENPLAAAEIARTGGRPGRIDYVFTAGGRVTAARLVADRPVDGVWLSDHFGVLADLDQ